MREDITNKDLSRNALRRKILAGDVLTYRRSFLDYIQWWALLVAVVALIIILYIVAPAARSGLPFEFFAPLSILAVIIHKKFNRKYVISNRGVKLMIGILSLRSSEEALSYSKLRAVEIKRTLLQRIFWLGDIGIETILGDRPEVLLRGIFKPAELAAVIDFFIAEDYKKVSGQGGANSVQEQRHTALYDRSSELSRAADPQVPSPHPDYFRSTGDRSG